MRSIFNLSQNGIFLKCLYFNTCIQTDPVREKYFLLYCYLEMPLANLYIHIYIYIYIMVATITACVAHRARRTDSGDAGFP